MEFALDDGDDDITASSLRSCRRRSLHYAAHRSEFVTFLSSGVVYGRKAPKSILPTSIAGVLRLRAIKPSVCDRSARRFAQDDDFVGGLEIQVVGYAENAKRSKQSQALEMTILFAW